MLLRKMERKQQEVVRDLLRLKKGAKVKAYANVEIGFLIVY